MNRPPKPFEELASEWAPRAKRFLSLLAAQFASQVKKRIPGLLMGSAFLFFSVFCVVALGAWLSGAAFVALRDRAELSPFGAALAVAGAFALLAIASFFVGKWRAKRPFTKPVEILPAESREIAEAGEDLITFFKDLTVAAKRKLSPNEVLRPHAVKVFAASTVCGFLIALNTTPERKTRHERLDRNESR